MAMFAMAIPISPGKTEAWKSLINDLNGSQRTGFVASRRAMGVRERTFFQSTPMGDMVIVTLEGENPASAFQRFGHAVGGGPGGRLLGHQPLERTPGQAAGQQQGGDRAHEQGQPAIVEGVAPDVVARVQEIQLAPSQDVEVLAQTVQRGQAQRRAHGRRPSAAKGFDLRLRDLTGPGGLLADGVLDVGPHRGWVFGGQSAQGADAGQEPRMGVRIGRRRLGPAAETPGQQARLLLIRRFGHGRELEDLGPGLVVVPVRRLKVIDRDAHDRRLDQNRRDEGAFRSIEARGAAFGTRASRRPSPDDDALDRRDRLRDSVLGPHPLA